MRHDWIEQLDVQRYRVRQRALADTLRAGKYGDALEISRKTLREDPSFVPALITVALVAQLSDDRDTPGLELSHGRHALLLARAVEALGGMADYEFGHFLFAVDSDSEAAIDVFMEGIARREAEVCALEVSLIRALLDIDRSADARARLDRARQRFPEDPELGALEVEFQ